MEESQGKRFNEGKPQYSLLPLDTLEPVVRVLEFGKLKYGRDNWKLGLDKDEIVDSLMRHLVALSKGEQLDLESGLHHSAHIATNAIFLLEEYNKINKE